ncbi:MAG: pyrroline-5-carboxylate reductase [Roseofilum sp. SBFL]|nr:MULTISPECIES: pyrroline-5-carboxylate reductase [unclassified Roseofilum]MBP0015648.1 pyrroline-5-carboxylate reductase [Roseofilum sp. SID3]MBP0022563.1 pyrroline-5-carboxylate reductase [Roseofilum sp. SID2]MBP0036382.1 pyrroline-5-carboxylate reductase [Roseofilum sp. SID1]MBP0044473.1 pyrroline-5-carboxylate reductase [Roseofilum sp. SBFL]
MVQLGIIGGGVMAEAILSRILAEKIYLGSQVLVSEPRSDRRQELVERYGVQVTDNNLEVTAVTEMVLLAIKPQVFDKIATELSGVKMPLLVSILAGVPISRLEAAFLDMGVIRVMPNAPATVGAGMSAIASGSHTTPAQLEQAKTLLSAVGEVVEVPETLMDAVTGLSGSGPAFVALTIEALSDGGVAAGLPRAIATKLAVQTVLGTAQMLQETGLHPGELKDRVTSPGGTTIAGVRQLELGGLRSALMEAVLASYERSQDLGR